MYKAPSVQSNLYSVADHDAMMLHGWDLTEDEFWFRCTPPAYPFRAQGWKIHVSSALPTAQELLDVVVTTLFEEAVAFKFAKSSNQLRALLSHRFDRGGGGKFITVYPKSDEHFEAIIKKLHSRTVEYAGPAILSDRRIANDSVIHYRYGAISGGIQKLSDQGYFEVPLVAPDGEFQDDPRNPWFSPPNWADKTFIERITSEIEKNQSNLHENSDTEDAHLLAGRFEVVEAIRHSNRGGVYRAIDRDSGSMVILKEARPFIGPEDDGTDMTDRLRHEYDVLIAFAEHGELLPAPILLFEVGGHLFLAETELPGKTLRAWRQDQHSFDESDSLNAQAERESLIEQLQLMVGEIHSHGYVLRDLTPANLMVHDGRLRLIDPEYFAKPSSKAPPVYTYGYAHIDQIRERAIEFPKSDDFSLGMCIAFILTGYEPPIIVEETGDDVVLARLEEWLHIANSKVPRFGQYERQVRKLLGLDEVATTYLAGTRSPEDSSCPVQGQFEQLSRSALDDTLDYLSDVDWESVHRGNKTPWRVDDSGSTFGDPASVQTGFAGVVQLLSDVVRSPVSTDTHRQTLVHAATWLAALVTRTGERNLPGLYFGRSGAAWALRSASEALDDPSLASAARDVLGRMPITWANPDMTHGLAGLGTAHLRELRFGSDDLLKRRARLLADEVIHQAEVDGSGAFWPIRSTLPDAETDQAHLGFAHGVAGMGAFLLDAADYFQDQRYFDFAEKAGATLAGRAIHRSSGAVDWPIGLIPNDDDSRVVRWWCSGSGGIGAFLLRLGFCGRDDTYLELARGAARACAEEEMLLMPGHCHGVSGNAHLFLDFRQLGFATDFEDAVRSSAHALMNKRISHQGRELFANDVGNRISVSYGQGLPGPASFLLRLLHGTERPFTWTPKCHE